MENIHIKDPRFINDWDEEANTASTHNVGLLE